jgi:hypothetical protein
MNIKLKQERYVHYCATRVLEKKPLSGTLKILIFERQII